MSQQCRHAYTVFFPVCVALVRIPFPIPCDVRPSSLTLSLGVATVSGTRRGAKDTQQQLCTHPTAHSTGYTHCGDAPLFHVYRAVVVHTLLRCCPSLLSALISIPIEAHDCLFLLVHVRPPNSPVTTTIPQPTLQHTHCNRTIPITLSLNPIMPFSLLRPVCFCCCLR